jgi:hypothetical protein
MRQEKNFPILESGRLDVPADVAPDTFIVLQMQA